jgi:hypothetical protein
MRCPRLFLLLTLLALVLGPGCPAQKQGTVKLTNNDTDVITDFWIRPSGTTDWGPRRLSPVLWPGNYVSIPISYTMCDFKIEDDNLDTDELLNVPVSPGQDVIVSWGATLSVTYKSETEEETQ